MKLKRSIASGFALAATAFSSAAHADEDIINSHARSGHPLPALSGYQQVIEPTLVPACSRDGWLIETTFALQAHEDFLRNAGGADPFRKRYREELSASLFSLINDAVESRSAARAVLFPPQEESTPGQRSITADLSEGIEKILSPIEKGTRTRLLVTLDTVRIVPRGCMPR